MNDMQGKGRRNFLKTTGLATAGMLLTPFNATTFAAGNGHVHQPAVLGGTPVRTKEWPGWPIWNKDTDEQLVLDNLRSGVWSRAALVNEFEEKWGKETGTKRCLSVVNGTNALITSLLQMNIGGGDEVIVPVYTFIATISAVLATGAIPVFVDTDLDTFQIDTTKIEAKITSRTRAIVPVHILGMPCDMVQVTKIARKHNLVIIEDACQAHFAEIDNKRVGSFGDAGCFSFQNSKNLAIGEGGAITSNNDAFMDRCYSYHNYGNPYGAMVGNVNAGTVMAGNKLRWTEYQAAIGLVQLKRLQAQTEQRNSNAAYLRGKIRDIPGIIPYKLYDNVTKAAFHLFAFRYKKEQFSNLPRAEFIKAMKAEGIPCMEGYSPLNKMPYLANTFQSKNYRKMYSAKDLDINAYNNRNECPLNDQLCREEAVWIFHSVLLADQAEMNDISNALEKVHANAEAIKKSIKA
ncbi:DegT/DnrJ/EryC1/StrS family aminotransferase [Flavihumibacter fluvii]|uniref:DegT/DnrJ/EryC1/StrS family aminotransferase n=1 Tax=Flavihumibacter fluvii TaxID=2838157 RepID=UPI001BDF71A9|nr:DegT/DnrJ/EryC1/StrS family aminotransferase [Flavihumibacter fluvii]ULQ52112.1 DegT/DnrJ/EryC1/StrS family aminotransferase [Flavihumibacter fluvii]